jgi:hypothetical protein
LSLHNLLSHFVDMPSIAVIAPINRVQSEPAILVFRVSFHLSKALSQLPIWIARLSIANLVHIGKILLEGQKCNLRGFLKKPLTSPDFLLVAVFCILSYTLSKG